jgi:hypothetical protein
VDFCPFYIRQTVQFLKFGNNGIAVITEKKNFHAIGREKKGVKDQHIGITYPTCIK